MRVNLLLLVLSIPALSSIKAQNIDPRFCMQLHTSTGGSVQTQDTYFSWTYGETAIATYFPYLTQGFQQPENQLMLVGGGHPLNDFNVYVAPNPTSDLLTIKIIPNGLLEDKYFRFSILDVFGKLVVGQKSLSCPNECSIDCRNLKPGMWLLELQDLGSGISVLVKFIKVD